MKTRQQELEEAFARDAKHEWCVCTQINNVPGRVPANRDCKNCKGSGVVERATHPHR